MTMNPLPPQAYTKETLGKAFAWLQSQPESIKELATSTDILVSLYLKAKLNGDGALERPSIQNFKSELKSLAGMMGEFEVIEPVTPKTYAPTPPPIVESRESSAGSLDAKSNQMIKEIQNEFNLSSESEAMRLLIATGFKTLHKLTK